MFIVAVVVPRCCRLKSKSRSQSAKKVSHAEVLRMHKLRFPPPDIPELSGISSSKPGAGGMKLHARRLSGIVSL